MVALTWPYLVPILKRTWTRARVPRFCGTAGVVGGDAWYRRRCNRYLLSRRVRPVAAASRISYLLL